MLITVVYLYSDNNNIKTNTMTTIKTFVQKTNDLIVKNNLDYSPELFNQILKSVMNDENNIIEEKLRVLNLNNQRVNENYNLLSNMCYSIK